MFGELIGYGDYGFVFDDETEINGPDGAVIKIMTLDTPGWECNTQQYNLFAQLMNHQDQGIRTPGLPYIFKHFRGQMDITLLNILSYMSKETDPRAVRALRESIPVGSEYAVVMMEKLPCVATNQYCGRDLKDKGNIAEEQSVYEHMVTYLYESGWWVRDVIDPRNVGYNLHGEPVWFDPMVARRRGFPGYSADAIEQCHEEVAAYPSSYRKAVQDGSYFKQRHGYGLFHGESGQEIKEYITSIHDGDFLWRDSWDDLEFTLQTLPMEIFEDYRNQDYPDGAWEDSPVSSRRLEDTLNQFRWSGDGYPAVVLELDENGFYEIIDGYHRLNALQILDYDTVDAWVGRPVPSDFQGEDLYSRLLGQSHWTHQVERVHRTAESYVSQDYPQCYLCGLPAKIEVGTALGMRNFCGNKCRGEYEGVDYGPDDYYISPKLEHQLSIVEYSPGIQLDYERDIEAEVTIKCDNCPFDTKYKFDESHVSKRGDWHLHKDEDGDQLHKEEIADCDHDMVVIKYISNDYDRAGIVVIRCRNCQFADDLMADIPEGCSNRGRDKPQWFGSAEEYEIRRWLKVLRDDPDWDDIDWTEPPEKIDDSWHDEIEWDAEERNLNNIIGVGASIKEYMSGNHHPPFSINFNVGNVFHRRHLLVARELSPKIRSTRPPFFRE